MNDKLISIQEAATLLHVSIITLRRWEQKGLIKPERTDGGHRRYHIKDIENLITRKSQSNIVGVNSESNNQRISSQTENTPSLNVDPSINETSSTDNPDKLNDPLKYIDSPEANDQANEGIPEQSITPDSSDDFKPGNMSQLRTGWYTINKPYFLSGLASILGLFLLAMLLIGYQDFSHPGDLSNGVNASSGKNASSYQIANTMAGNAGRITYPNLNSSFVVDIPAIFNQGVAFNANSVFNGNVTANKSLTVKGNLTAPNILYGINAGQNITISGDTQNPTISANVNATPTVTSLGGQTGVFTLGSGLSLSSNTLSNSDTGSSQDIFKQVNVNGTTFSAGSNNDTLTLTPGGGITLSTNTSNKEITIASNAFSPSGLTGNGVLYANGGSSYVSLTPGTAGYVLSSNGSGSPPSWVAVTQNPPFSSITSGTNTGAAMVVGTGASLDYQGSGTINASSLEGNTFESPGAIGSLVPDSGAFTTLSAQSIGITSNTNEIILGSGNTGTITMASLTGSHTYTLPDLSGTICLTSGPCSGSGGALTGAGTAGQLAYFSSGSNVTSPATGLAWDSANKSLGIGIDSPQGTLEVNGGNAGKALAILNETGDQAILAASSSGTTEFVIGSDGTLTTAKYTTNGGLLYTNGSGVVGETDNGTSNQVLHGGNNPGFGAVDLVNDIANILGPSNGGTGVSSFGGSNTLLFTTSANTLSSIAAGNNGVLVTGNTGIPSISSTLPGVVQGNITSLGIITTGTWQATVIGTQYGGTGQNFSGTATGSLPYFSSAGTMGALGIGGTGQILTVSGTGAPTWSNAGGNVNFWQLNNGALSPFNTTNDLLLGATSTSSARFAFTNAVGPGTPTASISGGLTGGLSLIVRESLRPQPTKALPWGLSGQAMWCWPREGLPP